MMKSYNSISPCPFQVIRERFHLFSAGQRLLHPQSSLTKRQHYTAWLIRHLFQPIFQGFPDRPRDSSYLQKLFIVFDGVAVRENRSDNCRFPHSF